MDAVARYGTVAMAGLLFGVGPAWTHLAVLALYPLASGRGTHTWVLVATFYVVGLFPITWVAHDYTGMWLLSLLPWLVPSAINTLVMGFALSRRKPAIRALCTVFGIVLLAVPPLSAVSVMSPAPVAGLLFPDLGFLGLALILGLIALLSVYRELFARRWVLAGLGLALVSGQAMAVSIESPPSKSRNVITGIDTFRGMPGAGKQKIYAQAWRYDELQQARNSGSQTLVFPESTFGPWHAGSLATFSDSPIEIIGGTRIQVSDTEYVNALVSSKHGVIYEQRQPIPYTFGRSNTAIRSQSSNRVNSLSALLCVELVNPWLANTTFARAHTDVVWAANLGWSSQRWLAPRMKAQAAQYARLYGKNVITAVNHPEKPRG